MKISNSVIKWLDGVYETISNGIDMISMCLFGVKIQIFGIHGHR